MSEKASLPEKEKVAVYFDRAAITWDTFYDNQRRPFMQWVDRHFRSDVFERFRLTFDEIGSAKGKTLLDIGCGSGPYAAEAARRGCRRVVGLDMAQSMIDLARTRVAKQGSAETCQFLVGQFPDKAPDEVFDHCIAMGVLDYIEDPVAFMTAVRKRTSVSAIISFPSQHWFRTPLRQLRYRIKHCPVYFYSKQQVEEIYRKAGFASTEVVKIPGAGMDYVAIGRVKEASTKA